MSDLSSSTRKRQHLRVLLKLMLGIGLLSIIYVSFSTGFSGAGRNRAAATLAVDLQQIGVEQIRRLLWENRPVIILHRSQAQIDSLRKLEQGLRDPDSTHASQPLAAGNALRSLNPQWFVALASGTDLGCSLDYLPERLDAGGIALEGAFRDRCRGSLYDLAGRVLAGQQAERNLGVPQHRIDIGKDGAVQLILGASTDPGADQ